MARVLRCMSIVVVALAALALCTAAWAQPGPGGGGPGFGFGGGNMSLSMMWGPLLNSPTVQKDLGLLEDQEAKIKEASEKAQTAMREMRSGMGDPNLSPEERAEKWREMGKKMQALGEEMKKTVEATLLPKQLERLKGIALQQAGAMALADKDVQHDLKLSDDQIAKIKSIGEESMKKARELFVPGGDREDMRTKMQELRKDAEKQAMYVLTAEQKDSLEKMKGAKLEIPREELRMPGFGGRRGDRNRDGDRPRATD
jgi:Spy/CpxP family protein refolding chaperone